MEKRLSNNVKPEGLSTEEWQKALRRQFSSKEILSITPSPDEARYGVFDVRNPKTKNSYKVVFRGNDSPWNYCSCMDFKTNQLGTCKHIEAVRTWLERRNLRAPVVNPPYSSIYISYKEGRKVCLRIGSAHWNEMKEIAKGYFSDDGVLIPEALPKIYEFIEKANALDYDFRCYPDATDFLAERQDEIHRKTYLSKISDEDLDNAAHTRLYPYQREGIRFAFKLGKSIIADEMGLGKTVQAIGTAELMRRAGLISSVLVLCPASLKYQWKTEIEKFAGVPAIIVEGNQAKRKELYSTNAIYKIVSYHAISNDIWQMGNFYSEFLIMDEIQRLKNWDTQISRAARRIQSDYAVVLSGTPLENKLEELYSIMEFVDPFCLGPYYKYIEDTTVKDSSGKILSYKNLNLVGERLKSRLIRRRRSDVALQLPERTDQNLFVPMSSRQRELHDEFRTMVARLVSKWQSSHFLSDKDRKRMLLLLSQMRMVCDSTYILDQESRNDTKIEETMNILGNVFASGNEKVVIFSQWERMTRLVAMELDKAGIRYSSLNGKVPSEKRNRLMDDFWNQPECKVFLSTDTGSTGLNLQNASLVINLDLPWNPAVLEQRISRIYRIGQKRNIQIINMISKDSFEEKMLAYLNMKSSLFEGILDGGDDSVALDKDKMDMVMDTVASYIGKPSVQSGDAGHGFSGTEDLQPGNSPDSEVTERKHTEKSGEGHTDPEDLVKRGMEFLYGLARTLQSPEDTARLVDTLVKTDEKTGKTELRIPVPDKNAVSSILTVIAKLMSR